jgi:hypothetical protein
MCVSGHCAPQPRFSSAIIWGAYDMWVFRGSRTWSQWGVVHRFHVLLACRKFWFSNIGGHTEIPLPWRRITRPHVRGLQPYTGYTREPTCSANSVEAERPLRRQARGMPQTGVLGRARHREVVHPLCDVRAGVQRLISQPVQSQSGRATQWPGQYSLRQVSAAGSSD